MWTRNCRLKNLDKLFWGIVLEVTDNSTDDLFVCNFFCHCQNTTGLCLTKIGHMNKKALFFFSEIVKLLEPKQFMNTEIIYSSEPLVSLYKLHVF